MISAAAKTATNASGAPLLNLKFNTPVDSIINKPIYMAIVPAVTGQMGILADHVKSMAQLKPGVVSLYGNDGNDLIGRYFVSGGFAKIDPEGTSISVADAVKLEDLDLAAAKKGQSKQTNTQTYEEYPVNLQQNRCRTSGIIYYRWLDLSLVSSLHFFSLSLFIVLLHCDSLLVTPSALEQANANLAKSTSEVEKAEISIQAECLEAIISAIETKQ